jgi:Amt family ammonium transporter
LVKLATLGCRNSLDDFGSGLSALNYIRDLPIHYLKIDGVFVRNIEKNQIDAAMIHSLNHMSKVMNLKTVAEFVEDEHTAILLRRLGVNYAQGYYCGRPLPLERLEVSKKTTLVLVK